MSDIEVTVKSYSSQVTVDSGDLLVSRSRVEVQTQDLTQLLVASDLVSVDTKVSVPISWDVVNPFPLWFGLGRIVHVRLVLDVPFNGSGSTLTIGDSGNNSRLMSVGQSDLSVAGTYETHPLYDYAIATTVNLYLNLGVGNSQGSGVVILYFS